MQVSKNLVSLLQARLVYIHPTSVQQYINPSPNLVTTTPPKNLYGLSKNFQEIFLKESSCTSEK